MIRSSPFRAWLIAAGAALCLLAPAAGVSAPLPVSSAGAVAIPAMEVPPSDLMSVQGNAARTEHIMLKRAFKGQPTEVLYRGVFGPGLERMKAAFPGVAIRKDTIAGVPVLIYEPRAGVAKEKQDEVLINVHGGGFQACFAECGGMESIPIVALTGLRIISIDYREGPGAHYPMATEDVVSVYRELLKRYSPNHMGLFGCSAGGILTAQSLAWFSRHDLPMPAAAGVYCAGGAARWGDSRITGSLLGDGETPRPLPAKGTATPQIGYMAGVSPDNPEAYPADHPDVLARFPPTLVVTGTRDFMLSSAVYLHSKLVAAGVEARLHVWEGGRHAFFYDVRVPEAHEAYAVMARFFETRLR